MIAYVDTSALLRVALGESAALTSLQDCDRLVASELVVVESSRTLDRLRLQGALSMQRSLETRELIAEWLESVDMILIQPQVLSRAAEPLPVPLGTLDAIHLASARLWVDENGPGLVMATHEAALALAARTFDIALLQP